MGDLRRKPAWLLIGIILLAAYGCGRPPQTASGQSTSPVAKAVPISTTATEARTASPSPCPTENSLSQPSPRGRVGLAYDAKDGYLLMFGGGYFSYSGCRLPAGFSQPSGYNIPVTDQTWEWDGTHWTLLHPATSPSARTVGAMAFDPNSQRVILFGGGGPNLDLPRNDMWAWDGTTWTELHPASMGVRCFADEGQAVFDRDLSAVVFVACNQTQQPDPSHLWEWNGSNWSYQPTTGTPPRSRFGFAFAYDPDRHQDVFTGGWNSYAPGDVDHDTWLLTHGNWTQARFSGPSPASVVRAAYDEARHRLVLVAPGVPASPDTPLETWTWDGQAWTHEHPANAPPGGAFTYDPATRQVVMFGGQRGQTLVNETWAWNGVDWTHLT